MRTRPATPRQPCQAPRYPHVGVRLVGEDGNAFAILGRTRGALREAGASEADLAVFLKEATAGDYHHLLRTVMRWVDAR